MGSRSGPRTAILLAVVVGGVACLPRAGAAAPPPAPPVTEQAPVRGALPIDVTGATRVEYDDATQEWAFRGARVVVVRGSLRIQAPEIRYNAGTRRLELLGRGTVSTPDLEVAANRMTASLSSRHVTAAGDVAGRFQEEAPAQSAGATTALAWTTFSANAVEVDDRPDARQVVATGQAVVVRRDQRLQGDRIVYNRITQQGTVDGHAEMAQGSSRLLADHVRADQARGTAAADDHVVLVEEDMKGFADHATYDRQTQTAVLTGNVTLLRGRDTLTADRATVHLDQHLAIAEGHPAKIVANSQEPSR